MSIDAEKGLAKLKSQGIFIKKLLELIQKSTVFLYTSNQHVDTKN